ncbi:MAG: hypothetical protein GY767_06815 [Shimia sp.]|nr:hypothetical protein [Shimia sp.]
MDRKFTFITTGIVLWFLAAFVMHYLGPIVFDVGPKHIGFWIANFFLPVLVLPIVASLTGRTKNDMVVPTLLITLPAMTLDSVAITFDTMGMSHVYASTPSLSGLTGGFLLFAFASFFFWALVWHRESRCKPEINGS